MTTDGPSVTWEELGNPTEPGIVDVPGIGTVYVSAYDLTFTGRDNHGALLEPNEPTARYKIGNWAPQGRVFHASSLDG